MNAFLRKTQKGLRFIGIAVLVMTGLSNLTVLAAEGDVDSLLVIPAASSEGGAATENLGRHIEFALGEALMEIGILPLAGDFLTMPTSENATGVTTGANGGVDILASLRQIAEQRTGRLLVVEIDLLTTSDTAPHPVPAASVVDVGSGRLVARTTTLPLLEPDNRLEIAAAAAALARTLARQLEQHGYVLSDAAMKPWGGRTTEYRLSLEGYELCERQDVLAVMEREFPGFLSIELVKAPNPDFAVYLYRSTATGQRLQKWIEQLMVSYRIAPAASSRVLVKDDSIRVQKDRSDKIYSPLCDG